MDTSHRRRWDIFCRVIDNFGDIGVSWRLARQLVSEHGVTVRLWVDHMASLRALCPQVCIEPSRQVVQGVEIFQFADESGYSQPADVAVEAFGCGLPGNYVTAMTARASKPLWIILEYLSAEPWVRSHHGLPSPHPQLNLPRYFYFPGFTEGTGGVLRETDLLMRRDAFDAAAKRAWWSRMGYDAVPHHALVLSLFAYPHAPVQALLDACAAGAVPVVAVIPEGPPATGMPHDFRRGSGNTLRQGNLEIRYVPFVPQADYDEMLWVCDVNFVRGEDSFVRAQWAGRPFVWHIYPQIDHAHIAKLGAFLDSYCAGLPVPAAQAVRGLWNAWNGVENAPAVADAWRAFCVELQSQRLGLLRWQECLARLGDAAGNLLQFSQKMI
jgi:uncharacterized repeat protein (TIGR03837 family)